MNWKRVKVLQSDGKNILKFTPTQPKRWMSTMSKSEQQLFRYELTIKKRGGLLSSSMYSLSILGWDRVDEMEENEKPKKKVATRRS